MVDEGERKKIEEEEEVENNKLPTSFGINQRSGDFKLTLSAYEKTTPSMAACVILCACHFPGCISRLNS